MQVVEKPSETHALWRELHQACARCIELARDLGSRLRDGEGSLQLQPLLEESAVQIGDLRRGIRDLARHGERVNPAERKKLLAQMRLLLDLDEQNHTLLGAKGVRRNTPHTYRYQARKNRH